MGEAETETETARESDRDGVRERNSRGTFFMIILKLFIPFFFHQLRLMNIDMILKGNRRVAP